MIARQRAGQVRERPARVENNGLVFMHVVQQEAALAETGNRSLHFLFVEIACGGAFEALHDARLVALGLQAPDKPGARVRESLVVEVDGVLRGEYEAEAVGARLFEQRQEQLLRWRVRDRRHIAEDLVHVEDCTQAGGAGLRAHPRNEFIQQHRHEKHALCIVEMRDCHDRNTRPAFVRVQQAFRAQWRALQPCLETGGGQQVVQRHRELEAVIRREERIDVHDADLRDRRVLDFTNQAGNIEAAPPSPCVIEQSRDQDVFTTGNRVRIHIQQGENPRSRRLHALAVEVDIVNQALVRCAERVQHRYGEAGVAARRVDGEVDVFAKLCNAFTALAPLTETLFPQRGLRRSKLVRGLSFIECRAWIYPGAEVFRFKLRKRQQQVAHVALGVDRDDRDVIERGFFE